MKIVVYHGYYGCDTGCCGHIIHVRGDDEEFDKYEVGGDFHFKHPWDDPPLEFAKQMVRDHFGEEHVKDLDWDNCVIVDDC